MLKRNLGSVTMSLAEIVIGILLLVNPVAFTSGIIVAFGIVLMITGVGTTIKYFRTEPEKAADSQILVNGSLPLAEGSSRFFKTKKQMKRMRQPMNLPSRQDLFSAREPAVGFLQ